MKRIIFLLCILLSLVNHGFTQCYPDRHSTDWFDAWISCHANPSPNSASKPGHWIVYDLKERYNIDKIKLWNLNDPAHLDWGIRDFKIEYSGNYINWFDAGEFRMEKANGSPIYEGMNWISVRMPEARYILITAISNYGIDECFGFAEINFSAEKTVITSVDNQNKTKLLKASVAPNPFDDQFIVKIQSEELEDLNYTCIDLLGRVMSQGHIKLSQSNYILRIITDTWAEGNYRILLSNSKERVPLALVKMKR